MSKNVKHNIKKSLCAVNAHMKKIPGCLPSQYKSSLNYDSCSRILEAVVLWDMNQNQTPNHYKHMR